jgi:mersacidin/lichenicidin family type 2 lantibiotic
MIDTIKVWKDATYRGGLTAAQLASVPVNPAGQIELSDTELDAVNGGRMSNTTSLLQTCTSGGDCCC